VLGEELTLPGCHAERDGPKNAAKIIDIIDLAVPHFSLIFAGYTCGKGKGAVAGRASPG
jgi:hypothetical protein